MLYTVIHLRDTVRQLKMSDRGRPTKYKPEYAELAYNYCLLGATDAKLAEFFDVDEATINRWKHEHEDFCKSLKAGKVNADAAVAKSLFGRATGMRLKKQVLKDGEIYELEDEIPPDATSMIFWLKNRQPDLWREKREVVEVDDDTGEITINVRRVGKENK